MRCPRASGQPNQPGRVNHGHVPELVDRVDEHDRVIDVVTRAEAITNNWLHRVAATVCRDEHGRVLVYRRAAGLSRFPDRYDVLFGGAVNVGEPYSLAAARELREELGVDTAVRPICKFLCRGGISPYWLYVHEAFLTGEITPAPEEIAWHGWLTEPELAETVKIHPFTPDGQEAFTRYLSAVRRAAPDRP
jgi:8-oxo-dGTP pyrophosphatase MutT (NUDIX family)